MTELPESEPLIRVMALHALEYCERLFYLEEVEEIRVADASVHAGRAVHERLDEPEAITRLDLESSSIGIRGRVDAMRQRDGGIYPIEHKRGRPRSKDGGGYSAWPADRLQAIAYAMLLEEHTGSSVNEARVRYHRPSHTARLEVDESARADVRRQIARARELRTTPTRPPVTTNERKCERCSLVPVCLPEEARLSPVSRRRSDVRPIRLFPADLERHSLHVLRSRARLGKSGAALVIQDPDHDPVKRGIREVSDVVIHGLAQVSTQALRMCANAGIPIHYMTVRGAHLAVCTNSAVPVQRRIRQYRALDNPEFCKGIQQRLVMTKIELQLRHAVRLARKLEDTVGVRGALTTMRLAVRGAAQSTERDVLLDHEGVAARAYFDILAQSVLPRLDRRLVPTGRTRRPPKDRFNALLSFAYGLLYRDLTTAVIRVGLEPGFGVLHQPRSTAYPLVLDLVELFRVTVADMAVLGAVNRGQFSPDEDFEEHGPGIWLSDSGRRKIIGVYERRKHQIHRHPALNYSLSWARMMELEVRLLEKEWSGEPGLFARLRLH